MKKESLVQVQNLKKHFPIRKGIIRRQVGAVQAVDGLTFDIYKGETLGLVGESGCGKSTAGRTILQLLDATTGTVVFQDQMLTSLSKGDLRKVRREMQMIFQDPYASLNPRMSVGQIVGEPLEIHGMGNTKDRKVRVAELLKLVGLNPYFAERFPHEFSGGQRQRVGIARALATNPSFIVADEPISSLDESIRAQIINVMDELRQELGLTYLFIADDMSMVGEISDRIAVMYLGRVVELGERDDVYKRPLHPYTQALLSTIPASDPDVEAKRKPVVLEGNIPDPADPPVGCRFHTRCPYVSKICKTHDPEFRNVGTEDAPHQVACHHAEQFF